MPPSDGIDSKANLAWIQVLCGARTAVGMDRAAIHAARSTRTALPSGRLGATTVRPGPSRIPPCDMHQGQVPGHCGGGLIPLARLKACESPWVLTAGIADILRTACMMT